MEQRANSAFTPCRRRGIAKELLESVIVVSPEVKEKPKKRGRPKKETT